MTDSPAIAMARTRGSRDSQRGAASLIVVMVLFFIVSLVAAYTSRNLIFEQRTSANQYRSTQAFEAAEAGLEWALARLNGGRITNACQEAGATVADTSFRQRYINIAGDGQVTPRLRSTGAGLWPSCVFDGSTWQCDCPSDAAPSVAAPTGGGVFPAFRVRFVAVAGARPGVVRVESNGCTRLDDGCLDFPAQGATGEGRATVSTLVALKGAITTLPAAALTVQGEVNGPLTAYNTDPGSTGLTIQAGGLVSAAAEQVSIPGTPADESLIESDPSLSSNGGTDLASSSPSADRLFTSVFGIWRDSYRDQPAAVQVDCTGAGCAAAVRNAAAMNPGRVLWVNGNLNIDTAGDVGSAAEPLVLVVSGNLSLATGARVYGLVYTRGGTWAGTGEIRGAAWVENNLTAANSLSLVYDAPLLTLLRLSQGSFVRLPGSWRDMP
jgi:hypothetical protein